MTEEVTGPRPSPGNIRATLGRLVPDGRLGLAVSGGPDSLALLLLAAGARPGQVAAATVDHGLRPESADEAAMVADCCRELGVPHAILKVTVAAGASPQARAREARYAALGTWATGEGLAAVATAHHLDDQAETILMRLMRGSGMGGLAGIRERSVIGGLQVVRPLLGWRKAELEQLVARRGWRAVQDPSNADPRYDRSLVRALLEREPVLPADRLALSAAALGEAEEALAFAVDALARERVREEGGRLAIDPAGLPREFRRRLLRAAMARLGADPSGPEIERALAALEAERRHTLGGLLLAPSKAGWTVAPEA